MSDCTWDSNADMLLCNQIKRDKSVHSNLPFGGTILQIPLMDKNSVSGDREPRIEGDVFWRKVGMNNYANTHRTFQPQT